VSSRRVIAVAAALTLLMLPGARGRPAEAGGAGTLTYSREVAPLVRAHCATCHRPGGAGPFELLTYADVRKHLPVILKTVNARVMPPWLPEPGAGNFAGDRRLDEATIRTLNDWAAQGAAEGDPADLPKPPAAPAPQWQLGKPDLVLRAAQEFTLGAEGQDLYHSFVLPTGLAGRRCVRAVEFHPGNARVVHHASLVIDASGAARRRDAAAHGAGFDGMEGVEGAYMPGGQNVSWQPGKPACARYDDAPWLIPAGADLVLHLHLRRQGKPEAVRPEVGLYFTDRPPATTMFSVMIRSTEIDLPAGASGVAVENSYVLPVDAEALGVFPHAHYLGKDARGWAVLPDGGGTVELLRIKRWNFNMQEVYTYREPIRLPAGTTLHVRWEFDNSAANPMNPSSPPRAVSYGINSTDEMGELHVQLRVRDAAARARLEDDYFRRWGVPDSFAQTRRRLREHPDDPALHVDMAKIYMTVGLPRDMASEIDAALRLDAGCAPAHYLLANLAALRNDAAGAVAEYRKCLERDPDLPHARADLGLALAASGNLDEATAQLDAATKLSPNDSLTRANYGRVLAAAGKTQAARAELKRALELDPEQAQAAEALKAINGGQGN
jgi:Tfp pilus assembly protein PilF